MNGSRRRGDGWLRGRWEALWTEPVRPALPAPFSCSPSFYSSPYSRSCLRSQSCLRAFGFRVVFLFMFLFLFLFLCCPYTCIYCGTCSLSLSLSLCVCFVYLTGADELEALIEESAPSTQAFTAPVELPLEGSGGKGKRGGGGGGGGGGACCGSRPRKITRPPREEKP
jgi:uncharacterized membrane protein YgcG